MNKAADPNISTHYGCWKAPGRGECGGSKGFGVNVDQTKSANMKTIDVPGTYAQTLGQKYNLQDVTTFTFSYSESK